MKSRIGFTYQHLERSLRKALAVAVCAMALLLAATGVMAGLPAELNNTVWRFTGIQFNATGSLNPAVFSGIADSNGTSWNGTALAENTGSLNGSLALTDYAGTDSTKVIHPFDAGGWQWNTASGQSAGFGVPSPLSAGYFNPDTNDTADPSRYGGRLYYAPLDGYGAVVGLSCDQTFNAAGSTNGTLLSVLVSQAAPTDTDLAGTWKYYAVSADADSSAEYAGQLVLNRAVSSGNGTGELRLSARENGAEEFGPYNEYQVAWTRSDDGLVTVAQYGNATRVFLRNARADSSKLSLYGAYQSQGRAVYATALKGSTFVSSNLEARFNMLAAGADAGTNATALIGFMDVRDGGLISSSEGNETVVRAGGLGFTDLAGLFLEVDDVTLNSTHTHSRLVFPQIGSFIGSIRNDKRVLAGVYHHDANSGGMLMFIVGLASEAGPVVAPDSAGQIEALTGLDPANATYSGLQSGDQLAYTVNSTQLDTAYRQTDTNFTQGDLTALVKSMQLGDEDIIANFPGAPGDFVRVTPAWPAYRWGLNSTSGSPLVLISWTIDTVGARLQFKRVSDLTLYKFKYDKDTSSNQTLRYTLRTAEYPGQPVTGIADKADGDFWITDAAYNKTALEASDYFRPGSKYVIWTLIRDNGPFDSDATPGQVADPPAGTTGGGGGSTSSGCTFNPRGTLDFAWLAVLAFFVAALFHFRHRA